MQPVHAEGFERFSSSDENDIETRLRQPSTEIAPNGADSNDSNSHEVYCREPCRFTFGSYFLMSPMRKSRPTAPKVAVTGEPMRLGGFEMSQDDAAVGGVEPGHEDYVGEVEVIEPRVGR